MYGVQTAKWGWKTAYHAVQRPFEYYPILSKIKLKIIYNFNDRGFVIMVNYIAMIAVAATTYSTGALWDNVNCYRNPTNGCQLRLACAVVDDQGFDFPQNESFNGHF